MRTIRVTGKGNLKIHPDTTRLTIILSGTYPEYADAVERSAKDTEQLRDVLEKLEFDRADLKTLSFDINTKYEYKKDRRGDSKRVFAGYEYQHHLKLEFESDNQRLGKTLYALAHSPVNPEFKISYTVKDPEASKNQLLGKAIQDAKEKAVVLTQAAGVELQAIQSIDYSWGRIDFEFEPMEDHFFHSVSDTFETEKSLPLNLEPDDIEVSDTVTVIWEIA